MKTRKRRERDRSQSLAAGFDFQCARCFRIFAGPDEGWEPGRVVTEAPLAGEKISHTWCDDCLGEIGLPPEMVAELDAKHGPVWRERLAEIRKRNGES